MLEYIDYKEVFLKLFFSYRTFLYVFLIYYLIKNRSDWKRMSYQLFAVNIFFSIISLVVNIYPLNLKDLEFFYFFGYASGIYFFYGLVAYFLETDIQYNAVLPAVILLKANYIDVTLPHS